ncbi:hypothetical protein QRI90_19385, partial [Acinetobacter baumannii]
SNPIDKSSSSSLSVASASRYFCFALGNGRLLGLVLGSFFRVSQKYSVESIILTHKKTALRRWLKIETTNYYFLKVAL